MCLLDKYEKLKKFKEMNNSNEVYKLTIEYLKEVENLSEEQIKTIYLIAKNLMRQGDKECSKKICTNAVEIINEGIDKLYFYNLLGNIEIKNKNIKKAIEYYLKAEECTGGDKSKYAFVTYNLLKAYCMENSKDNKASIQETAKKLEGTKFHVYVYDLIKGDKHDDTSSNESLLETNLQYSKNCINELIGKIGNSDIEKMLREFNKKVLDLKQSKRINSTNIRSEQYFYHYTPIHSMEYLIPVSNESRSTNDVKLRMYNAVHLNDPEEGMVLINNIKNKASDCSKKILDCIYLGENYYKDENTYILSLTESENDCLPLWVHYGERGNGYVISFESNMFDLSDSPGKVDIDDSSMSNSLYKVEYIDDSNTNDSDMIQEYLDELAPKINGDKSIYRIIKIILDQIRYCYKNTAYSYEKEVRVIKFAEGSNASNDIVKFEEQKHCDSHIKRMYIDSEVSIVNENIDITLGPNVRNKREVAAYLYKNKINDIKISKIKYK